MTDDSRTCGSTSRRVERDHYSLVVNDAPWEYLFLVLSHIAALVARPLSATKIANAALLWVMNN